MIDKNRLAEKCSTWNISLSPAQLDQLDHYAEILVSYNEKVNLTAITSPEGIEDRHFADSLLFAAQPEVQGKMVDVGTGAGFPGIVAKIYKPDLELTLMEPTGKRVEFLKYACAELGLTGVEFAKERAEEAARKVWREQFDIASARAVAALPVLSEYCLPLVKVGGVFIAMKGPEADAEAKAAVNALKKLGGKYRETRQFTLPDGSARGLVVCEKISQTPTVYPRNRCKTAKRAKIQRTISLPLFSSSCYAFPREKHSIFYVIITRREESKVAKNELQKQGRIVMLPVDCIEPSPYQARTAFDEPEIAALAVSILQNGLLQPISVRRVGLRKYQLIAGERRLRACRLAKLEKVPAILADYDDSESAALGLLENLQRSQLDPFDTARGIKEVIRLWGCTQAEAARRRWGAHFRVCERDREEKPPGDDTPRQSGRGDRAAGL